MPVAASLPSAKASSSSRDQASFPERSSPMISVTHRASATSTARWYSVSSMAILGSPCPASAAAFASSTASVSVSLCARWSSTSASSAGSSMSTWDRAAGNSGYSCLGSASISSSQRRAVWRPASVSS